jgi:hypothetical protein
MDNINLIILLFPGIISIAIINFLIKKVSIKDDIIGVVFFAGLNYLIAQLFVSFDWYKEYYLVIGILIAIVLAGLSIWLVSINWIKNFIIKTRGSIFLTAWDTAWRQMSISDSIVICEVKLKDGEIARGYYTQGSSASFSSNKDRVFLIKTIENSDTLNNISKGILIPHNEISYIKFYKGENDGR